MALQKLNGRNGVGEIEDAQRGKKLENTDIVYRSQKCNSNIILGVGSASSGFLFI